MRVGKIAHAGITIETDKVRCLMDPVLSNKLVSNSLVLNPAIRLDPKSWSDIRWDALVISHEHDDHFDLASIARVNRDARVIHPSGASWIRRLLAPLGFKRFTSLAPWKSTWVGDLRLTATPSRVSFPEMGVLFQCGSASCWNIVDSVVDAEIVRKVRDTLCGGRIDFLLSPYQPTLEEEIYLSGPIRFPRRAYAELVRTVVRARPVALSPSAFGYRNRGAGWLNQVQFPVTEREFLRKIGARCPGTKLLPLRPGNCVTVAPAKVSRSPALDFVRARGRPKPIRWRPAARRPALCDDDSPGYGSSDLRARVEECLERDFPLALRSTAFSRLVRTWAARRLVWNLTVVFPDGGRLVRQMRFAEGIRWRDPEPPAGISSEITASGLLGFLDGLFSSYAILLGAAQLRVAFASATYRKLPDPLMSLLFRNGPPRHRYRQLLGLVRGELSSWQTPRQM